jgi:prolyl 4-hydroxylase
MKRGSAAWAPEIRGRGINENAVMVVDDFLELELCTNALKELVGEPWLPSEVVFHKHGPGIGAGGRHSESLASGTFGNLTQACIASCEKRLGELFAILPSNLEPWQFVRYGRGDRYDYHLDCGAWSRHRAGERRHTILVVIEQPVRGGATHFRALRKTIRPIVGRLVIWRNLLAHGNCNHAMIHAGRPVWQGRKTILVTWEHERAYR